MYLAILTKQAWSVKALLSVAKTKSFLVGQFKAGNSEREDKSILPARVANQKTGFASPCALVEPPL